MAVLLCLFIGNIFSFAIGEIGGLFSLPGLRKSASMRPMIANTKGGSEAQFPFLFNRCFSIEGLCEANDDTILHPDSFV